MGTDTLIIDNVDFEELEKQRKQLIDFEYVLTKTQEGCIYDVDALQGIINMLNEWSDKRYFEELEKQENNA